MNLKKIWNLLTSKSAGTGPSSYEKSIYRAAVSQMLRDTALGVRTVTSEACCWAGKRVCRGIAFEPLQEKFPGGQFVWVGLGDDPWVGFLFSVKISFPSCTCIPSNLQATRLKCDRTLSNVHFLPQKSQMWQITTKQVGTGYKRTPVWRLHLNFKILVPGYTKTCISLHRYPTLHVCQGVLFILFHSKFPGRFWNQPGSLYLRIVQRLRRSGAITPSPLYSSVTCARTTVHIALSEEFLLNAEMWHYVCPIEHQNFT